MARRQHRQDLLVFFRQLHLRVAEEVATLTTPLDLEDAAVAVQGMHCPAQGLAIRRPCLRRRGITAGQGQTRVPITAAVAAAVQVLSGGQELAPWQATEALVCCGTARTTAVAVAGAFGRT